MVCEKSIKKRNEHNNVGLQQNSSERDMLMTHILCTHPFSILCFVLHSIVCFGKLPSTCIDINSNDGNDDDDDDCKISGLLDARST